MRILIADDEKELLFLLSVSLKNDFFVDTASDADEAKACLDAFCYQVAVFDRTFHGVDMARELVAYSKKKNPNCGVLILSALGSVDDKVEGLFFGADDYLEKPFDTKELKARIIALARRYAVKSVKIDDIEIDISSKNVLKGGKSISLSKNEDALLFYLLSKNGQIASREEIMDAIYENPQDKMQNTIDELVARVRKKLSSNVIKTVKTRGFVIEI
jgi:two-component system OmpR family response regulator